MSEKSRIISRTIEAVSHPGSTGKRSLVGAEHKNVIFNDLGTKNCCVLLSY